MRTFKRPMFRKGGNVDNGIMTGIVDRTHAQDGFAGEEFATPLYSRQLTELQANAPINSKVNVGDTTGNINLALPENRAVPKYLSEEYTGGMSEADIGKPKTVEEYLAQLKEGAGEYGGMDPLTSFLLTAGPSVAGATSFADAVNKLQPATAQLIKGAGEKAKYNRDLRRAAVNLGLQDEQKFDDRRFNWLMKQDDRTYQQFLTQDERDYLAEIKTDDRLWNKDLIKNEREFNLQLLKDQRAYAKLTEEDKRDYKEKIDIRARAYQKLDEEGKREYEKQLIQEGRAFELDKIIRAEKFQEKMFDKENDPGKRLDDMIETIAIKSTQDGNFKDVGQARNNATWTYKKADELRKQGYNIGSIFTDKQRPGGDDPKTEAKFAKTEGKKKRSGSLYYDDVNNKVYQLTGNKDDGFRFVELDESMSETVDSTASGTGDESIVSASKVSLNYPDAQTEAKQRNLVLIPERPKDNRSKMWLKQQRDLLGENAVTKKELEEIIWKEKFADKYKNIKPRKRGT